MTNKVGMPMNLLPEINVARSLRFEHSLWTIFLLILLVCPGPSLQAASADHPIVTEMGLAGNDLPAELFLVRSASSLTSGPGLTVHGRLRDTYLVSGTTKAVQALPAQGCFVLELPDPAPDLGVPRPIPVQVDKSAADPRIQRLVNKLSWKTLSDKIQWLVDFRTRYSLYPHTESVAESLQVYFTDLGLESTLQPFFVDYQNYSHVTFNNVISTQVGSTYPDQYFIIGAHYDSISENPNKSAPGADDNATGTATVMAVAEILSQYTFEYSIKYICFGGEEQGLLGSSFYAYHASYEGEDILGMLNFDMLGYWQEGLEDELEIETNAASLPLAAVVVGAAELYTDAVFELHENDMAWWGDHFFFWMTGYQAINHEESYDWDDPDFNPYYHTTEDLPEYVHPDFTLRNARVGLASLATLAIRETQGSGPGPDKSTSILNLGAYPNPFNGSVHISVQTDPGLRHLDLEVFDLRGRLVISLPVDLSEGRGQANWLARDSAGHPVESGVYLCRPRQNGASPTLRISYVK